MSVITIYKCDKCKTEQDTNEQFWTLEVNYKCGNAGFSYSTRDFQMQVCRPCLEKFGIIVKPKTVVEEAPKPITIEDLIYEIVGEALSNQS